MDHEICRHEHHPGECIEMVNTWWPVIAKLIYGGEASRHACAIMSEGECDWSKYVHLKLDLVL